MAITVNPPVITNQVTGETEAIPDSQMVISTGTSADSNTVTYGDDSFDPAFNPEFQRTPVLNDPAFQSGASEQDINSFWKSNRPLTDDEINAVQANYLETGNEQLARLLAYKVTGDTTDLFPDDYAALGISEPQESDSWSDQEIDNAILTNADDPSPQSAQAVLRANIGTSNAATVVKHLAHQYYSGQISAEEAYFKAGTSGVSQPELYKAFNKLAKAMG